MKIAFAICAFFEVMFLTMLFVISVYAVFGDFDPEKERFICEGAMFCVGGALLTIFGLAASCGALTDHNPAPYNYFTDMP